MRRGLRRKWFDYFLVQNVSSLFSDLVIHIFVFLDLLFIYEWLWLHKDKIREKLSVLSMYTFNVFVFWNVGLKFTSGSLFYFDRWSTLLCLMNKLRIYKFSRLLMGGFFSHIWEKQWSYGRWREWNPDSPLLSNNKRIISNLLCFKIRKWREFK